MVFCSSVDWIFKFLFKDLQNNQAIDLEQYV